MGKHVRRLLIAAVLSASGAGGTWHWYQNTKKENIDETRQPIARLSESINEVQRKQTKRLIWQTIHDNDNLYPGEAIRTAANAEARIEFIKSGTAIDLDPDSVVVLEENQGQVALDFVKGNLFVRAGSGSGDENITLKSGQNTVALGKSEVSLGKDASGKLDLQVLKGSVSNNGKNVSDLASGIRVTKPAPGESVYINPAIQETVAFEWEKLQPGYDVFVETGSKREKLVRSEATKTPGDKGKLASNTPVGKYYWRLIAVPNKPGLPELKTATFRMQILAKLPPLLLEPEKDAQVMLNPENPQLIFRWANPANLQKLTLEVSKTPDMKTKAFPAQPLDTSGMFAAPLIESGLFYWRITGYLEGKTEGVASAVQKFQLSVSKELLPPVLKTPRADERIQYQQFVESGGITLSWNPVPGVKMYKVAVMPIPNPQDRKVAAAPQQPIVQEVAVPFVTIKTLRPGGYTWSVYSKGSKGEFSKPSERRIFNLSETPELRWVDGKDAGEYLYVTEKPSLGAQWERGPAQAVKYRARYLVQGAAEGSVSGWIPLKEPQLKTPVPADNTYVLEVEALDVKDIVVARAPFRTVAVRPAPLLAPPQYAQSLPAEILAQSNGHMRVVWVPVPGANQYVVTVRSPAGASVKEARTPASDSVVKSLLPGDYKVGVRSVDQWGRIGPEGELRPVKVPDTSGVRAPKMKKVEVK